MRITFLNPPFHPMFSRESRSPCVTKSSTLYWPMFLSYAAGSAEEEGHEIQLIDSPAMSLNLQETIEKIKPFSPELFIVSTSTPSILNDLKVVKALKETFNVPVAIMMGSEEDGISEAYLKRSDEHLLIPMPGDIDSLNVSVATGIVCFEVVRQRMG